MTSEAGRDPELDLIRERLFMLEEEEMLIIKAHLLTERFMWQLLERKLALPSVSDKLRLRYLQLLNLTRIVSAAPSSLDWLWDALTNLNRVRNKLAHELVDPDKLGPLVTSIFKTTEEHVTTSDLPIRSRVDKLRWVLMILCAVTYRADQRGTSDK
ncbi:MAG: hypothetical protein IMZ50_12355 [Candidatus Atribacteria bacterium]|nr:hypothetical protein [Candidatus Atribacteria bacterium]